MSTKPDRVAVKGKNGLNSEDKEHDVSSRGGNSYSAGNHSLDLAARESENSKDGGKSGEEGPEHRRSRTSSIDWVKQPILPPQMTKMKGLLKGLRYISQIFETNAKEQEMQIGYPTDVKHVAHIGWDGPSVNTPSWMNEFSSRPDFSSAPLYTKGEAKEKPSSNREHSTGLPESPSRSLPELPKPARSSRRNQSSSSSTLNSPTKENSDTPPNHTRRNHSSSGSVQSPRPESPSDNPSKPRRHQQLAPGGLESPTRDSPGLPKQSRHRKTKGSRSTGGSLRSSRSKPSEFSDPDIKNVGSPPDSKSTVEEEI